MAKRQGTAITKTTDEEKEIAALAELSDFFDSVDMDGMEHVDGEDIRLAVKLFNLGSVDPLTGNSRAKNAFFDNITEEMQPDITCVLLLTQKTNRWDRFDNAKNETEVLCQSRDRLIGILTKDGERRERECKGCPDRGWFTNPDTGDPMKRCGDVHNVVAIESKNQRPFIVRFKKTALKAWRNYLMQHHWKVRQLPDGTLGNIPFFAFECKITLVMHESGKYALPVFERGRILSRVEAVAMHESCKGYLEMMGEVLSHADKVEGKHGATVDGDGRDPSINADDFADDS